MGVMDARKGLLGGRIGWARGTNVWTGYVRVSSVEVAGVLAVLLSARESTLRSSSWGVEEESEAVPERSADAAFVAAKTAVAEGGELDMLRRKKKRRGERGEMF